MKICHYGLGLEPYRKGGCPAFIKYLIDEQCSKNVVIFLYPGCYSLFSRKPRIIRKKTLYNIVPSYELKNPKPIPLCNGIKNVDSYVYNYPKQMWMNFFNKTKIDIIHVHTLFGLDKHFFDVCKELRIKTLYTTHDLFGLCPKTFPMLFDYCKCCASSLCEYCSLQSFSFGKTKILQSNFYLKYKNSKVFHYIRGKELNKRAKVQEEQKLDIDLIKKKVCEKNADYERLQMYYISLINDFDYVHFNSKLTQDLFLQFCKPKNFFIKPVFHSGLCDNRFLHTKPVNSNLVEFVVLGTNKGMYKIIESLDMYWNSGIRNFRLSIYSDNECGSRPYLSKYLGYSLSDLQHIFASSDALLFCETSFATFSFIICESLSYGVPCIVSGNIGAIDLINNSGGGLVTDSIDDWKKNLGNILMNPSILEEQQLKLKNSNINFNGDNFLNDYFRIIEGKL